MEAALPVAALAAAPARSGHADSKCLLSQATTMLARIDDILKEANDLAHRNDRLHIGKRKIATNEMRRRTIGCGRRRRQQYGHVADI